VEEEEETLMQHRLQRLTKGGARVMDMRCMGVTVRSYPSARYASSGGSSNKQRQQQQQQAEDLRAAKME
jgi:hypothetical protein